MSTSDCLEKLVSLREKIDNWKVEENRHVFLIRFYGLFIDPRGELPNLRDIFRPEEIECLLLDSINYPFPPYGLSFVRFAARTGYKINLDADKEAEQPSSLRTTLVHRAARSSVYHVDVVALFKIHDRTNVNYTDESGLTHFHVACQYGCADVAKKFLEQGQVDPNLLVPETGDSPLHFATRSNDREVIELLLRAGADPNAVNKSGDAPLHLASRLGNKKAIELLLRRGVDPNSANADGEIPLHLVCQHCRDHSLAEFFFNIIDDMQLSVQINARNKLGKAPLHLALGYEKGKVIESLLRRGADPNLADAQGLSPLQLIFKKYRNGSWAREFFKLSKEVNRVARVDARDEKGRTLLQWAVANLKPNLVDVLLENGADLSSFAFPTEMDFDEHFESYASYKPYEHEPHGLYARKIRNAFKLEVMSDAFEVVRQLENRGYQLIRVDAVTIMKFFAKNGLSEMSADLDESWLDDKEYEKKAKELKIFPHLSIHDFMRLPTDEATRLLTYRRYNIMLPLLGCLPVNVIDAAHAKAGAILMRGFFRAWALESFMELVNNQLPLGCCEIIIDESFTNKNLLNICLAATDRSRKESVNKEIKS